VTPSTSRSHAIPWRLLENLALLLILFGLWLFGDDVQHMSLIAASRLATVIALVTTAIVVRGSPRGMWSPSATYMIILVLFHVGLVAAYGLGRVPEADVGEAAEMWLYRRSTPRALWVTDLGIVGYAIGVCMFRQNAQPAPADNDAEVTLKQIVGLTGCLLTLISVFAWFSIALNRGGPRLLVSSYSEFLTKTEGSSLPFTDRLSHFGMAFMMASQWSKLHRWALSAFVIRAAFEFPLGLRSEVLFPTFAALTIYAYRRIPMRGARAALLAIGLLSAIAMIRDLRQVGIGSASSAQLGANPLDGLAEMGSSLRPVAEVVFWHEMGDRLDDGATYWAPIDRSLYYVIPGWTRLPIEKDSRVMTNLVMDRVGPIGFSIIAEAYRNFAATGALVILFLVGLFLGQVDSWPTSVTRLCATGVVLTGLLLHVRNSFVPLPAHFVIGFALIALMHFLSRARLDRTRRAPHSVATRSHRDSSAVIASDK
jgi:O-antigen polysaccharide polymerase Wzy